MKRHGKSILAAGLLVCVAAVLLAVYLHSRPAAEAGVKRITVEVVHSDERVAGFTYDTEAEYLGEVLLAEGLIQGETGAYGLYITVVDGEEAVYERDGAYWALYQGEDYAQQGVNETAIADGDLFRLVYTHG